MRRLGLARLEELDGMRLVVGEHACRERAAQHRTCVEVRPKRPLIRLSRAERRMPVHHMLPEVVIPAVEGGTKSVHPTAADQGPQQPVDEVLVQSGRRSKRMFTTIRAGMALWARRTIRMAASAAPSLIGSRI